MCGYCTESFALEIARAEARDQRCAMLDGDFPIVLEMFVQEASDIDAALALEARFPLSALCRRIEAAWLRGQAPPPFECSGHEVIGAWSPPRPIDMVNTDTAEEAARVLERFAAWWAPALAAVGAEGRPAGGSARPLAFDAVLPELWAAFAVVRLCCPRVRVVGAARALAKMEHPGTPSLEARELWLQRRAILAWHDAAGSSWSPLDASAGVRPELVEYLSIRRRGSR